MGEELKACMRLLMLGRDENEEGNQRIIETIRADVVVWL
jgi:hypothetical protein